MKPAWKNAPKWANYRAQNMFGQWIWFEHKPEPYITGWVPNGKREIAVKMHPDWQETLERRPGK